MSKIGYVQQSKRVPVNRRSCKAPDALRVHTALFIIVRL